jgi:hypothetical protein
MTRLPHENRDVVGLDGSDGPQYVTYKVGPICSVPECSRLADHSHHIWRRSFVIGDKPWVRLWDGTITGNLTGLCWRHHNEVTEGEAIIRWTGTVFVWDSTDKTGWLLSPQPPIFSTLSESDKTPPDFLGPDSPHEHVGPGAVEKCPACKRALPRERKPQEGKRPRKAWSVSVPVDERENGADVLDTLLVECAKLFGHDESGAVRYFTLAQALALVVQHGSRMVGDA